MRKRHRSINQFAYLLATATLCVLLSGTPSNSTPALVVDLETAAVLHAEEAGTPWYPASTTKLMTALVVFEKLKAGNVTLDTTVVLSQNAMNQKFLNSGLSVGRAMSLEDALFATIAGSANDVAVAVAETVAGSEADFVNLMNTAATRLGMSATHFTNPNGLFNKRQQTSARDLAILAATLIHEYPHYLQYFRVSRVVIDEHPVESYNELLTRFPGAFGMKTGFLCASGRNIVGVAERQGRKVLVVLLGATTERERGEHSAMLLEQAFSGKLRPTGEKLFELPNQTAGTPRDMRTKLCSNQAAAYERTREALYPMGLPGHASYLSLDRSPKQHKISTWLQTNTKRAPIPTARPTNR